MNDSETEPERAKIFAVTEAERKAVEAGDTEIAH